MGRRIIVLGVVLTVVAAVEAQARPLPIPETRLFELGVADYDGDGRLDVFSTNHQYPAALLRNLGRGRFRDVTEQVGLSTGEPFPGLERAESPPSPSRTGLYVYLDRRDPTRADTNVELRAHGTRASGRVILDPRRNTSVEEGDAVVVQEGEVERIDFDLAPGELLSLRAHAQLPVRIMTAARTFVGSRALPAPSGPLTLQVDDRHGYALADLDGSGNEDLFAVLGGVGGTIGEPPARGRLEDRVLLFRGRSYRSVELGLRKDDCQGRQAGAIDADGDGRVDLFTSCAGAHPVVFVRRHGGWSRETIGAPGRVYRWVQVPPRPRPRLLALGEDASLWERRGEGTWVRVGSAPLRGPALHATIADFSRNGSPDVFVSSRAGNTLLSTAGGELRSRNPRRLGLPGRSTAASWVDVDNDGRVDLHAIPNGLFKQVPGRSFRRTGRLRIGTGYGHLSWADLTGNGLRDLLFAITDQEMAPRGRVRLIRNRRRSGRRWLAVDLPGALQASRIRVRTRGGIQVGWAGQSDDSRYSQSHNRVYFALGRAPRARIVIRTPAGERLIRRTRTDRVVRIG